MELRKYLEGSYPELRGRITGENYPIPPAAAAFANFVSIAQVFLMATVFMGDAVWNYVPFFSGPPDWYFAMKENSAVVVIGAFLVVPTIAQKYVTTGAFEIILDGQVVFSKLELGRFPNGNDIMEIMTNAGMKAVS